MKDLLIWKKKLSNLEMAHERLADSEQSFQIYNWRTKDWLIPTKPSNLEMAHERLVTCEQSVHLETAHERLVNKTFKFRKDVWKTG